jgi:hypothetical protein
MTTMTGYYAHDSQFGPVFDVANYSRFKAIKTALISLGFGCMIGLGAAYFWNPDWVVSNPSEIWADAHQETKDLIRQHPLGVKVSAGCAALFATFCFAAAISLLANAVSNDFYIRVGEGGISLRVPDGLLGTFHRDLPWSEVDTLTVVQEKRLGAMSRNAGNTGGELQLRTREGFVKDIRLDQFRQDAWLIHQRIEEAREMRVADFSPV